MGTESLVQALRDDGFCVVADVIPASECRRFREIFHERYRSRSEHILVSPHVALFQGAITHAPEIGDFLSDPRVIAVAEALLASPVRTSFATAIVNDAGASDGPWHADWPFDHTHVAHMRAPYPDLAMHVTSLWALSPPAADLGGTTVVAGSHRLPSNPTYPDCPADPPPRAAAPEPVHVAEGGVLLLDSRVWHARTRNASSEPRVLFAAGYVPWWLNLDPLLPGAPLLRGLEAAQGKNDFRVPLLRRDVFARLSPRAQTFFAHAVEPTE